VPDDCEISEDAAGSGTVGTCGMRAPMGCGVVDIVLEFPDTKVIGTLVLPGTDLRLYEWEEGSRGLSERGSRRGGAVAAQAVEGRGRRRYSTVATVRRYCSRKEGERRRLGFLPAPFRKPETIICFCLISCESLTSYLYPFT